MEENKEPTFTIIYNEDGEPIQFINNQQMELAKEWWKAQWEKHMEIMWNTPLMKQMEKKDIKNSIHVKYSYE